MKNDTNLTHAVQMEAAVENALQREPMTAHSTLTVAVQGSTVTLTGRVESQQVKVAAEKIASGVPGVLDVINELAVGEGDDSGLFGAGRDRNNATQHDTAFPGVLGVAAVPGTGGGGTGVGGQTGGVLPVLAVDMGSAADQPREDTEDVRG